MKILVCITHVPDTTSKISFVDGDKKFNSEGVSYIIGPYDDYALAKAVEIKEATGAEIVALHIGTAASESTIRKALAIGADKAIRVDADPSDSLFVAQEIAAVAKKDTFDMILMGRESIDFNGAVVHGMVAEMLNWPCVNPVMKLDINGNKAVMLKEIEGGKETVEVSLPFVAGCQEPIAEWKIPNMRGIMAAKTKSLEVISPSTAAEATSIQKFELPASKGAVKLVDPENVEELVRLLRQEAKVI